MKKEIYTISNLNNKNQNFVELSLNDMLSIRGGGRTGGQGEPEFD